MNHERNNSSMEMTLQLEYLYNSSRSDPAAHLHLSKMGHHWAGGGGCVLSANGSNIQSCPSTFTFRILFGSMLAAQVYRAWLRWLTHLGFTKHLNRSRSSSRTKCFIHNNLYNVLLDAKHHWNTKLHLQISSSHRDYLSQLQTSMENRMFCSTSSM